jgi:hypothetical protein
MISPIVFVGTNDGLHKVGAAGPRMLAKHSVDHVVATASGIWAISDGRTVWLDPARGDSGPVAQLTGGPTNCILVAGDRVVIGTAKASLVELVDGAPKSVVSFEEVPGRAMWYTPWGGPPDVRSMARGVEGTIYVNVHVGGVVRSIDEGMTWTDTLDIHSDVHQVIADPDRPGHAYAASAWGLAVTTDGADTWEFLDEGLHSGYCRAVAVSATSVFVSASLGPQGQRAALYRRPLAGGTLQRCTEGLPAWFGTNLDTFCLAARNQFVVAADADGTVYSSIDDGATWRVAAEGLPRVRCLAIV